MTQQPRIETLTAKKLIGKNIRMSFLHNKTADLWRSFMQERKNISNTVGTDLYSIQIFDSVFDYQNINPASEFTKWAAVEVTDWLSIPENMDSFSLTGGLYAVFIHKGTPSDFRKTFDFIFLSWLPQSNYVIDNRPHFDVLGEKYINNHPNSEEEIWIPIKPK